MYGISVGFFGSLVLACMLIFIGERVKACRKAEPKTMLIHVIRPTTFPLPIECLVCMELVLERESVSECTSCHQCIGHVGCIAEWIKRQNKCPHCQVELEFEYTNVYALLLRN